MTYLERASKSVNNSKIIFSLDITQQNVQWTNHGAGVWVVNSNNLYPWIDSTLLTGFSAQVIPDVGSVLVDNEQLAEALTLLDCSDNEGTFYWDGSNLYIHMAGGDSPFIHTVLIGIVFGYTKAGFTPVNSKVFYPGRLISVPSISQARDPLYWGKLQYTGGSVQLNNGDGYFDLIGEDYNIYGNQARIEIGFEDLPLADYERLFTGFVESVDVDETGLNVSFIDKRKQLTKPITYTCTAKNSVEAIQEILLDNYAIPYNGIYYNTAQWEAAIEDALDVTINMQTAESAIKVIEGICQSTFGVFLVDNMGRYSFKIIRPADPATFEIPGYDILNYPRATYNPSEAITSTKIGYARDWTTSGSAYTYLYDTSQESDIFAKYKTYNQRTFDTYLPDLTTAQAFSDIILDYAGTVRPVIEVEVPIKYYNIEVGDFAEIEINRASATWFGVRKCEVLSKTWNLDRNTITLKVKKYGDEISYRATTDGYYRITTDDELRKVGA